jgi:catechol 1,2-dioxygenase
MKRRTFLQQGALTAFTISSPGSIHWNGHRYEADSPTTSDILGPFYRPHAPMRSNLIPTGSTGTVMHLKGKILDAMSQKSIPNVLVEAWQCDEHEKYDNYSDDFRYRGAVRTGSDGSYRFKTIVPIPYNDGGIWRPAHIHLRISSAAHQDLITQIYFKGDRHIPEDPSAASPLSAARILEIKSNANGEKEVNYLIRLPKTTDLDPTGYAMITGIYKVDDQLLEFTKEGDLLMVKVNGQFMEGLSYKGNNTFSGGLDFVTARFEIEADKSVKVIIHQGAWVVGGQSEPKQLVGKKILKY